MEHGTASWVRRLAILVTSALAVVGFSVSGASGAAAAVTATYSATITIPVPPASNFAAPAGGDGWDVALSSTRVYNAFHHLNSLSISCHVQTDSSDCWGGPKTITQADGTGFSTGGQPGLRLDNVTGHLYVFATRDSDSTAGVVCIDTNAPDATANPFCGFTPLSTVGASYFMNVSGPMRVGTKSYAYLYGSGEAPNSATGVNQLLCFDTATAAACPSQPFAVDLGTTALSIGSPPPAPSAFGSRLMIPANAAGAGLLGCFDDATQTECAGSWPAPVNGYFGQGSYGAAFPLLDSAGSPIGLCLPLNPVPCLGLDGMTVSTPANLAGVFADTGGSTPWNGPAVTLGSRVYIPDGNVNYGAGGVRCFDYAVSEVCAGFPKSFTNASYLYTVNRDPNRPSCLWINADNGSSQIQNFDAYSGGSCGEGTTRVLASSFVVNTELCRPSNWQSMTVLTPAPGSYSAGTVDFLDNSGASLPAVPQSTLDSAGSVDLSGMALTATLPQFLITLADPPVPMTEVVAKFTWTATYDESCTGLGGEVVPTNKPPTGSTAGPYTGSEGAAISIAGSASDPDGDTITTTWSVTPAAGTDAGAACTITAPGSLVTTVTCTDDGTYTLTLTVNDGTAPPVTQSTTLTVANVAPHVTITSPADNTQVNVGSAVTLTATVTDAGSNDTQTYTVDWGDGSTSTGAVSGGSLSATHTGIGAYAVVVKVLDDDGGSDTAEIMLTAADKATKVTGGGFVIVDGGRTSFGLVATQDATGPHGQIQVRIGTSQRFHGDTVSAFTTSGNTATWSGTGRWDGTSGYTYQVTVTDTGTGKKAAPDTIAITVKAPNGTTVWSVTGPLRGGNLKIH